MKKIYLTIIIVLFTQYGFAEVPLNYEIVAEYNFDGTTFTCEDSGDGCDEGPGLGGTTDEQFRYLAGTDSTGYDWEDINLGYQTHNYFNDAVGTAVTSISTECHDVSIISDAPLYTGGTGYGMQTILIADCNPLTTYSRSEQRIYADPTPTNTWESLEEFYLEYDLVLSNISSIGSGHALSLLQISDDGGGLTTPGDNSAFLKLSWNVSAYKFYLTLPSGTSAFDPDYITPEENKPFRIRLWWKSDLNHGTWKATYDCPGCAGTTYSPNVETTIKDWTDVQTLPGATYGWTALKWPRAALGNGVNGVDVTVTVTHLLIAQRVHRSYGTGTGSFGTGSKSFGID